jgi:hypothetical protein
MVVLSKLKEMFIELRVGGLKIFIFIFILLTVILAGWIDGNFLGCYKFLDAKINMSWVEAQHECEVVGGYLAEPVTTG